MKRRPTPELLDTDCGAAGEIAASLADLRRINRWFGGISTTRAMIEELHAQTRRSAFSLLEVAAGSGDVPLAAQQRLARRGVQLELLLLDRRRSHLNGAAPAVAGDALALPFRDNSFDLVSCGQFTHHLSPSEVIAFVQEGLRVCRIAVLINDLVRHPLHSALVYAGLPLFRSRLTRHDAPASVRQAYTVEEMRALLAQTTAIRVRITRHYLFRMGAIAWKA